MTAAASNNFIPLRLGSRYVQGMQIAVASNTTLTVQAGSCRDSSDQNDLSFGSVQTINFANIGVVNGLDTGAIGASKLYYVYAIGNSLDPNGLVYPQGGLVSLSSSPLLPPNYDVYRRTGWAFTDGSSHLVTMYQSGDGITREYFYDTIVSVLSGGTSQTLAAIDLSSAVPALDNMTVYLDVSFTPNTAGDKVSFAPAGSSATVLPSISGVVSAKAQTGQFKLLSKLATGVPKIQYINSAASGATSAWVYGFQDVL